MVDDPATLAAATSLLAADPLPAPGALWAATYVYSLYSTDPAPLRPLLGNDTPGVALMAAAGLVLTGDGAGFPALVDALTNQDYMPGWDGPYTMWRYATRVLVRAGNQQLGPAGRCRVHAPRRRPREVAGLAHVHPTDDALRRGEPSAGRMKLRRTATVLALVGVLMVPSTLASGADATPRPQAGAQNPYITITLDQANRTIQITGRIVQWLRGGGQYVSPVA